MNPNANTPPLMNVHLHQDDWLTQLLGIHKESHLRSVDRSFSNICSLLIICGMGGH